MSNEKISVTVPCGFCHAEFPIQMTQGQFNEIMSSWNVGVTYNDLGFNF